MLQAIPGQYCGYGGWLVPSGLNTQPAPSISPRRTLSFFLSVLWLSQRWPVGQPDSQLKGYYQADRNSFHSLAQSDACTHSPSNRQVTVYAQNAFTAGTDGIASQPSAAQFVGEEQRMWSTRRR